MDCLEIISPVSGQVTKVGHKNGEANITIYIPPEFNHSIFSPIEGQVVDIKAFQGTFSHHIYKSSIHETGRILVTIQSYLFDVEPISFWIEVGEGYITDMVRLEISIGSHVEKGKEIGSIVIGSLAQVQLPNCPFVNISQGSACQGGKTILGYVCQ